MNKNLKYIVILILFFNFFCNADDIRNSYIVKKDDFHIGKVLKKIKITEKKGEYTIASVFGDLDEIKWAKNFEIVELGGVDDNKITKKLLKKKGLLSVKYHIAYDWMPAFYYYTDSKNRDFVNWLYENKDFATLNTKGPFIHCKENKYDWCQDYYYNLANKEVFDKRVKDLVNNMATKGFNGLFFDWAPGIYIEEEQYKKISDNFVKLNPNKNYFDFVSKFYKKLKSLNIFVVTNQGFRKDKYILPYTTYDMTESYITTNIRKKIKIQIEQKGWVDDIAITNYYPIYSDSKDIKDSLKFIDLLSRYKKKYKKYGFKNFIYLNYLAPDYERVYDSSLLYRVKKPKNGIYFSYAMAKLEDNLVYAEVSDYRRLERDKIYFYDLGDVLGEKYEKLDAIEGYVRFYKKGFVLVSKEYPKEIYLRINSKYLKKNAYILDAYENNQFKSDNKSVVLHLKFQKDIFTKKTLPLGRVYLYL